MQKKNHKLIKTTIISAIAIMLLLLLILSNNIINLQNKNKLNIAESTDNTETPVQANIPKLSAGMIPIKWNGESWIITSKDDTEWYNYNVTDMRGMFEGCSGLTELNVSNFDTTNVTNMSYIFKGCSDLTDLDVSNFNTTNVVYMQYILENCSSLTNIDLSNFDTRNVIYMPNVFNGCSSLSELDLSSFDTTNVTSLQYMFYNCSKLTKIYVNQSTDMWSSGIKNSTSSSNRCYNMFTGCGTSTVTRK